MTLGYESSGEGIPLVLIHAFPFSSKMWEQEIKSLESEARIIAVDLPGFGASPLEGQISIAEMAKEVALTLDSLKVQEPVVIAGLSMGGYVALEFFRQFPTRVKALGLFSTRAGADLPEASEKRLELAKKIGEEGLGDFPEAMLTKLLGKTTLESNPEVVEKVKVMISSSAPEGIAAALLVMAGRQDSTDLLKTIKVPTLIMAGEEDAVIPFLDSENMRSEIEGSMFHLLKESGHLLNLEKPALFQKNLRDFLTHMQ